jgi:hypothetical protein
MPIVLRIIDYIILMVLDIKLDFAIRAILLNHQGYHIVKLVMFVWKNSIIIAHGWGTV